MLDTCIWVACECPFKPFTADGITNFYLSFYLSRISTTFLSENLTRDNIRSSEQLATTQNATTVWPHNMSTWSCPCKNWRERPALILMYAKNLGLRGPWRVSLTHEFMNYKCYRCLKRQLKQKSKAEIRAEHASYFFRLVTASCYFTDLSRVFVQPFFTRHRVEFFWKALK